MNRPNVIMVLADQHCAGLLGCAGHPQVQTPRLDAFAGSGVRFTEAYCQNPICTPSRVSILSGQYPHNTGYFGLAGPAPDRLPSLFGYFREHGYRTAGFGKLHLPLSPRSWVADHVDRFADSYDTADGRVGESAYLASLEGLGLRHLEDSWHNPVDHYGKGTTPGWDAKPSDMPYEHTQERWCVREALRFIDEASDDPAPFFVQVAFQKPHHPLLPVREFWDLYDDDLDLPPTIDKDPAHRPPTFRHMWQAARDDSNWSYGKPGQTWRDGARRAWRGTLANISQADDVFGRLLDGLDDRGLAEDTIVVYGSDHGCYHTIHGLPEKAPGIGSDAVCRVPMIWRVPGHAHVDRTCDQLVENVDYAPTLARLCGLPEPDWTDGHDLTALLEGDDHPIRAAAFTEHPLSKSVRFGRYRMTHYPASVFGGEYAGELYDLDADPNETRNLYTEPDHQGAVAQGTRLILDWLAESNRVATFLPAHFEGNRTLGKRRYPLAADGKLARDRQPARRVGSIDKPYYL
ncbi:MAG: sulfatase-like hydrolase/transferase [Planctomycetota bacterium]